MFGFQNYPTKYKNINLEKVRKIQSMYPKLKFGYADHTAWNEPNNELITLFWINEPYNEEDSDTYFMKVNI